MLTRTWLCATSLMYAAYTATGLAYATPPKQADTASAYEGAPMTREQERAQDRALARAVRKSIEKEVGIDATGISILAKNGVVTLVGRVRDQRSIQISEVAASRIQGVLYIDNRLIPGYDGGR